MRHLIPILAAVLPFVGRADSPTCCTADACSPPPRSERSKRKPDLTIDQALRDVSSRIAILAHIELNANANRMGVTCEDVECDAKVAASVDSSLRWGEDKPEVRYADDLRVYRAFQEVLRRGDETEIRVVLYKLGFYPPWEIHDPHLQFPFLREVALRAVAHFEHRSCPELRVWAAERIATITQDDDSHWRRIKLSMFSMAYSYLRARYPHLVPDCKN